jgi:hypothetical protein
MEDQKNDDDIVTYERLTENDQTSVDYKRQLNAYVLDNLPLKEEQKAEFLELVRKTIVETRSPQLAGDLPDRGTVVI